MLFYPRRVKPASWRMRVTEPSMVVPDWTNIVRVSLEQQLRRGVDAPRRYATERATGRLTGLMHRTLDIKCLPALITPEIVSPHAHPSQPLLLPRIILPDTHYPTYPKPVLDEVWTC
jgi:hypothetical protein